jgi:hypothetical protein
MALSQVLYGLLQRRGSHAEVAGERMVDGDDEEEDQAHGAGPAAYEAE